MTQQSLFDIDAPVRPAVPPEPPPAAAPKRVKLPTGADLLVDWRCELSPDQLYRWWLEGPIIGSEGVHDLIVFLLQNPSKAKAADGGGEDTWDPTLGRCIGFARREKFRRARLINLCAYRETDSQAFVAKARAGVDVVGPRNDEVILASVASATRTVVAWGERLSFGPKAPPGIRGRDEAVLKLLEGRELYCFGYANGGAPRHPLMLANDTPLERYERRTTRGGAR